MLVPHLMLVLVVQELVVLALEVEHLFNMDLELSLDMKVEQLVQL